MTETYMLNQQIIKTLIIYIRVLQFILLFKNLGHHRDNIMNEYQQSQQINKGERGGGGKLGGGGGSVVVYFPFVKIEAIRE